MTEGSIQSGFYMRALVLAALLALLSTVAVRADEGSYGSLDFSRMTPEQSDFFWKRLRSLAVEEAVLTYCGQPDDFAQRPKRASGPA